MSGSLNKFSNYRASFLNDTESSSLDQAIQRNLAQGTDAAFSTVEATNILAETIETNTIIAPTVSAGVVSAGQYIGLPPLDIQNLELKQDLLGGGYALDIETTNRNAIRLYNAGGGISEINMGYMSGSLNGNLVLKSLGNNTFEGVRLLRNDNSAALVTTEAGTMLVNRSATAHADAYKMEVAGNTIIEGTTSGSVKCLDGDVDITGTYKKNGTALHLPERDTSWVFSSFNVIQTAPFLNRCIVHRYPDNIVTIHLCVRLVAQTELNFGDVIVSNDSTAYRPLDLAHPITWTWRKDSEYCTFYLEEAMGKTRIRYWNGNYGAGTLISCSVTYEMAG